MNFTKQLKKIGNYQLLEVIGKGANAIVYKGLNNENGCSVAIKQITMAESEMKNIQFEIYLLRQLEHKHIVKYIDAIQVDDYLYIVLEYIEGGNLANLVRKASLTEKLVKVYIKQVILGLDYLHQMGVVHRDIKGANILLNKDGIVKLADFGGAMRLTGDNKTFSMMGTPYWMSPEMIQNKGQISTSCDIWSLGCTIIQLLSGKPPYFQLLPYPALIRIVQDPHPPLPPDVSTQGRQFLLKCFNKDPSRRPKASQLLNDVWLRQAQNVSPLHSQIDIKQYLKQRDFGTIIKNLGNILNKKIIYTNPLFIELIYDPESQDKIQFFLVLLKQDYECLQYFCSIGLFNRIFSSISPMQVRMNKLCAEILYQIVEISIKHASLSFFNSICIDPLKKLFNLGEQKRCMKVLHRLFSEQILPISHLGYIICKQGFLIRLFIYIESTIKSNWKQCSKTLTIIEKISSSKEPSIQSQFQPVIQTLSALLGAADKIQQSEKILKTIYNVSKHELILEQFFNNQIVPILLNFLNSLKKKPLRQQYFQTYYYIMKIINAFSDKKEGLIRLKQNGWKQVLEGITIKQIIKKDIQQIYEHIITKI